MRERVMLFGGELEAGPSPHGVSVMAASSLRVESDGMLTDLASSLLQGEIQEGPLMPGVELRAPRPAQSQHALRRPC